MAKPPTIPNPFIRSLPPADQARLKRNFDELLRNWTQMPFTVVAADGTGDFKSIAAAIVSLPAGNTNFSHLIYVKTASTPYDDTATTIDLNGRSVTIMGQDAAATGLISEAPIASPLWLISAAGFTNSGSTAQLRLINLDVFAAGGAAMFNSGIVNVTADNATLGNLYGATPSGDGVFRGCNIGTVFTATCNVPTFLLLSGCKISNAILATGITVTFGSTSQLFRMEHGSFTQPGSATISYGNLAGEQSQRCEIVGNTCNSGGGTLTFNKFENGDTLHVVGNSGFWPGITVAIGSSGGAQIVFDANSMRSSIAVTEGAGAQLEGVYIGGLYKSVSCAANGAQISAVLDQRGVSGGTALTISGNQCSAMVGIIPGTTTTGVNLSGNNNIVIAPNITSCTTPSTVSGTGNSINSLPPSGSAGGSLTGSYPNPVFAGRDASVDKLNQDMLPSLLSGSLGVVTLPTPTPGSNPTGAAGGSLAGTYPNPTFAGRDASIDKLNQDMLPTLLGPQEGILVYPTQPIAESGVAGLVTDLDERRKNIMPALVVPPAGIVVVGGSPTRERVPSVAIVNTATQAIATGTNTNAVLPVPTSDPWGLRTSTTQLTIPNGWAGWYQLAFNVAFPALADSTRRLIAFQVNAGTLFWQNSIPNINSASSGSAVLTGGPLLLAAGDLITFLIRQDSAGSITLGIGGVNVAIVFVGAP